MDNVFQAFACGKTTNSGTEPTNLKRRMPPGKAILCSELKPTKVTRGTVRRKLGSIPVEGDSKPPAGLPEKLGSRPLRLVLVGHNPSEHAWQSGHYYSNPANKMWSILMKTGIAPGGIRGCQDDNLLPEAAGVGFTDVGSGRPGTDSSKFTSADFQAWQQGFFDRIQRHTEEASSSIGCSCCQCGAPSIVAFTGKRQYAELLKLGGVLPKGGKLEVGPQAVKPPGWPLPDSTEVWVMTSTSGASALSNEEREAPYFALSQRMQQIPWPRECQLRCQQA